MGICVEERPGLGRVVVATSAYKVGELVLDEAPLLVWTKDRWDEYLHKFTRLPQESKASLLDMFHPPLDKNTAAIKGSRLVAETMTGFFPDLSADLIHKLIMISNPNCHQYIGKVEEYAEHQNYASHPKQSALFEQGSKVAHSCIPNVVNSTKNEAGHLHFNAIRPIETGDILSMSYLGEIWTTPAAQRQAKLLHEKDFQCQCNRCSACDDCRVLRCPRQCGSHVLLAPATNESPSKWVCDSCGFLHESAMTETIQAEQTLAKKMADARLGAQRALSQWPPNVIERFVAEITSTLAPTHHIVAQSLEFMAMIYASHAAGTLQVMQMTGQSRGPFGTPEQLRVLAAKASLRAVQVCECIAASCRKGTCGVGAHAVVHECAGSMFYAAQDLQASGYDGTNAEYNRAIIKYLPSMRINFGKNDADVVKLDDMVNSTGDKAQQTPSNQLVVGCEVLLHSLSSGAEHNGKRGIITQYIEEKQRYAVQVAQTKMSLKPSNLLQLGQVWYQESEGCITGMDNEEVSVSVSGVSHTCSLQNLILVEGIRVRLHGLSKEEYNNHIVEIMSFDKKAGRYRVKMEPEKVFSVLPSKISLRL